MSAPTETAANRQLKTTKCKPTRILPTDRITFPKQLNLLRAWAAASGQSGKIVINDEVARIVKMVESTVSMANAFFTDVGFLQKQPDSGFVPAAEVLAFNLAYDWNPDTAAQKLGPLVEQTWFAQAIMPTLGYGPMGEEEAVQLLAQAANASPEKKGQLSLLLEYMKAAGLIVEENGQVRRARFNSTNGVHPNGAYTNGQSSEQKATKASTEVSDPPPNKHASVATTFTVPTEGVVQFNVSVRVNMQEFSSWEPGRIGAFFGGIAEVLKAKAAIEKGENLGN
jgi:hypothetical protein